VWLLHQNKFTVKYCYHKDEEKCGVMFWLTVPFLPLGKCPLG